MLAWGHMWVRLTERGLECKKESASEGTLVILSVLSSGTELELLSETLLVQYWE